jgi:ankyrin repeat protein
MLAGWLSPPAWANELHDAAKEGDLERVNQLVAAGADLADQDVFGTPLHHAAARGHAEVVRFLLAEGADVNAVARDGAVPLHWAAYNGRMSVVALLLAAGAELDVENATGAPLHLAAQGGRTEVVEMQLAAGADANARISFGRQNTPLHLAASGGPHRYRRAAARARRRRQCGQHVRLYATPFRHPGPTT